MNECQQYEDSHVLLRSKKPGPSEYYFLLVKSRSFITDVTMPDKQSAFNVPDILSFLYYRCTNNFGLHDLTDSMVLI